MKWEIIIQEAESGDIVRLPMAPDRIQVRDAARFLSYDILNTGEHKIPLGEDLTEFSWEGLLPGSARATAPYVNLLAWMPPGYFLHKFAVWKSKGTKLKLIVPLTPIHHAVYLESFQHEYSGGMGDVQYSLVFCTARDVIITTEEGTASQEGAGIKTTSTAANPPAAATYTVKRGDSLWKIAQKQLGDGTRWREIYQLNQGIIGPDPDRIYPGQVYNMPA